MSIKINYLKVVLIFLNSILLYYSINLLQQRFFDVTLVLCLKKVLAPQRLHI
jgi:hypothetical protein